MWNFKVLMNQPGWHLLWFSTVWIHLSWFVIPNLYFGQGGEFKASRNILWTLSASREFPRTTRAHIEEISTKGTPCNSVPLKILRTIIVEVHMDTFISSSRDNCALEMPHLPELLPVLAIPSSYSLPSPALSLLPLLLHWKQLLQVNALQDCKSGQYVQFLWPTKREEHVLYLRKIYQ